MVSLLLVGCSGYSTQDSFDLGDGFQCKITSKNEWEPNISYYYEITRNGIVEVPKTFLAAYPTKDSLKFLILAKDNRWFGLSTMSKPNDILMLFDKKELNSWPHRYETEDSESAAARADKLLSALRVSMKNEKLKFDPDR